MQLLAACVLSEALGEKPWRPLFAPAARRLWPSCLGLYQGQDESVLIPSCFSYGPPAIGSGAHTLYRNPYGHTLAEPQLPGPCFHTRLCSEVWVGVSAGVGGPPFSPSAPLPRSVLAQAPHCCTLPPSSSTSSVPSPTRSPRTASLWLGWRDPLPVEGPSQGGSLCEAPSFPASHSDLLQSVQALPC